MKHSAAALLLLALAGCGPPPPDGFFEPFSPAALAEARRQGRPVLLEAYARW